ncbi:hypothetical protein D3C77_564160 [compost metagenome]
MSLNKGGEFKVFYDYKDWLKTDYSFNDRLVIWQHKYLNQITEEFTLQDLIEKFKEEYPHNPIYNFVT